MQPHGGKSCPRGCIARFLNLRFLPLKLVHQHKHDMMVKKSLSLMMMTTARR